MSPFPITIITRVGSIHYPARGREATSSTLRRPPPPSILMMTVAYCCEGQGKPSGQAVALALSLFVPFRRPDGTTALFRCCGVMLCLCVRGGLRQAPSGRQAGGSSSSSCMSKRKQASKQASKRKRFPMVKCGEYAVRMLTKEEEFLLHVLDLVHVCHHLRHQQYQNKYGSRNLSTSTTMQSMPHTLHVIPT